MCDRLHEMYMKFEAFVYEISLWHVGKIPNDRKFNFLSSVTELAQTWLDLFEHGFPKLPSLAYQTINRMLFSDYLKCHLDLASTTNTVNLDLSVDEENILRYAAGFVPFKLKRDHFKQNKIFELLARGCSPYKGSVLIPCWRPDLKALSSYKRFINTSFEHPFTIDY